MARMKGGYGEGSSGANFITKAINILKSVIPYIVPTIIIVLFLVNVITHGSLLQDFFNSRWQKYTSSVKSDAPYNESLNITYCNINNTGTIVYNDTILTLFQVFTILFILFWYNYIIGLFSKTRIDNEIKILGYDKYYKKNITNNSEYWIVNIISIYILITFLYYGYMMYDSYMGTNTNEIEIYKNIKLIDQTIADNINCDLYSKLIKADAEGGDTNQILKTFFEKTDKKVLGQTGDGTEIAQRLKLVITCVIATDISFVKIKNENNICSAENDANIKCIYRRLYNIKSNKILPDYNDINLINVLANPTYLLRPGEAGDIITTKLNVNENLLKEAYEKLQSNITNYSREINKHTDNNVFYYKIGLIFATLSSILLSIITLVYFIFFEFAMINKSIHGDDVYIGVDYYLNKFSNSIMLIVSSLVVILGAFIINF
jgi:hypothetical protein